MPKLYACIISPDIKRDRGLLVGVADRFASVIEVIEDGVLFDVSGLERLVGKPDRIAKKIVAELKRRNVEGKVAVADTVDTAKLLARCTIPTVREGENAAMNDSPLLTRGVAHKPVQSEMFDQLPLSGLDIERDTLNVFSELGLHTIKDLAAVPQDDLIGRYGRSFQNVIDVIEQRGRSLITPNIKENKVSWSFELNNPVEDFEQLIFLLNHGLERLFAEVKYAGRSTEYLDISLKLRKSCTTPTVRDGDLCRSPRVSKGETSNERDSPLLTRGVVQKHTKNYEIKASFPTLDRAFWLKLINLRAALDPPEEMIIAVDAVAHFTMPRTDQRGLYAVSKPEPESLLLTVGKLKKLVGEENVGTPKLVNQRLERPFTLDAEAIPDVTPGNASALARHAGSSGVNARHDFQVEESPRTSAYRGACVPGIMPHLSLVKMERLCFTGPPAVIGFNHFTPLAAEVLAREGRLVYIRTRLFTGYVTNFSGVWKGNSHWWDRPWKTQEWDIEIENGGVYRLCKTNDEWFLTGEYD